MLGKEERVYQEFANQVQASATAITHKPGGIANALLVRESRAALTRPPSTSRTARGTRTRCAAAPRVHLSGQKSCRMAVDRRCGLLILPGQLLVPSEFPGSGGDTLSIPVAGDQGSITQMSAAAARKPVPSLPGLPVEPAGD
jgi:hypothetical protein